MGLVHTSKIQSKSDLLVVSFVTNEWMNEWMSELTLFNFTSLIIMVVPSQKTIYYKSSLDALKKLLSQNGYTRGAVNSV